MSAKNRVMLTGHLGQDPEIRTLENGNKLAKLRMATTEFYVNSKGDKVNETEWHSVVGWGKLAEQAAEQLSKGTEISVEGKLTTREYVGKDGLKRWVTEVVAYTFTVIEKKQKVA